jgi:hypothetical protein
MLQPRAPVKNIGPPWRQAMERAINVTCRRKQSTPNFRRHIPIVRADETRAAPQTLKQQF